MPLHVTILYDIRLCNGYVTNKNFIITQLISMKMKLNAVGIHASAII